MSSPYSISAIDRRAGAGFTGLASLCVGCAVLLLSACGSTPTAPSKAEEATAVPSNAAGSASTAARTAPLPDSPTAIKAGAAPAPAPAEVPKRAAADFDRAVNLMRSGNATEAELEFKQLAIGYPQLAGPQINLALIQRKAGRLEEAEATLKAAVERSPGSVVAWNELGVTLRMRGQFGDATDAYEHAIAADASFAPAHRNLAVLLDLYLGDPERALTELERYKELTGEEKPVNGWIAELRQRTGKPATPKPAAPPPAETAPVDAPPAAAPPATTPPPQARANVLGHASSSNEADQSRVAAIAHGASSTGASS